MADPTSKIVRESSGVLSGTRAVDGDGRLLVLRHATNRVFSRFERTSDIGFHFGSSAQARKRVANMVSRGEGSASDAWRTVTCVLAVRNPLVIPDDPGAWNPRWMTSTLCGFLDEGDRAAIRGFERELAARAAGSPVTDREEALLSEWNATLRAALERGGHDGIVYRNVFESSGRAIEWSWVVFDDAQAVRVPHTDADGLDPAEVEVGEPPRLRGVRPMRDHQDRGIGRLSRERDVKDFREAVEAWATESGIDWRQAYPLDYEPSFGEGRPSHDLVAKVGEREGYHVRVDSRRGTVLMQPFSETETCTGLMRRFGSDWSEAFFLHGPSSDEGGETVSWRPVESLEAYSGRLARVHADFHETFCADASPTPSPTI